MKSRFVILLVLVVLFTIFVLQNSHQVTVVAYLWEFNIPLSLLMVIIAVIGIILGLTIAAILDRKKTPELTEDKTFNQINTSNPNIK